MEKVDFIIGVKREGFQVAKRILRAVSQYPSFHEVSLPFETAEPQVVEFVTKKAFQVFVTWLDTGELFTEADRKLRTYFLTEGANAHTMLLKDYLAERDKKFRNVYPNTKQHTVDLPLGFYDNFIANKVNFGLVEFYGGWTEDAVKDLPIFAQNLQVLVELYIFADAFSMDNLCRCILYKLEQLYQATEHLNNPLPNLSLVQDAGSHLEIHSPMMRFLVHITALAMLHYDHGQYHYQPLEQFHGDLVVELMSVLRDITRKTTLGKKTYMEVCDPCVWHDHPDTELGRKERAEHETAIQTAIQTSITEAKQV